MRFKIIICFIILFYQNGFTNDKIKFSNIRAPYKSMSPTISELQKLDDFLLQLELNKFWTKANKTGLPLIEKDALYNDYLLVTLIYQDSSENIDVTFEIFGIYEEYRFGDMKMHRLTNTDLYYRCYLVPDDICFSYRFNIKDNLTGCTYKRNDKFNSNRIPKGKNKKFSYSVLDLRVDKIDWNIKRYENINSRIDTVRFKSNILNNDRDIYIYLPPDYMLNKKVDYPVIFLFDSFIYLNRVEVPTILDNLITEDKIKPMISVLIDNPDANSRKIELPLNDKFKDFIILELVPFIRNNYNTSANPSKNIIGGISYGGLAATFISFYHSDIFGKVLSQSGSFWRDLKLCDNFGNEIRNDRLIRQFNESDKKSIKIFLDWGLQENMVLGANRNFVRILNRKGYDYRFVEFNGWHDWSNSRTIFPIGLMYLLEN